MMDTYRPPLLGKILYKKLVTKCELSSFMTVSDEVFILLILKNNELVWPENLRRKIHNKKFSTDFNKEKNTTDKIHKQETV